ncbi:unnamed protein product, partial [Pocillopora meandrina]
LCGCSVGKYLFIKSKQVVFSLNNCIRCMFFAYSRESSHVFYKLLDILNIVKLSTCPLAHKILNNYSSIPFLFYDSLRTVSSLHKYNARYASKSIFIDQKFNTVKFTFVYVASKFWETVPTNWKRLSIHGFKKRYKYHPLKYQS